MLKPIEMPNIKTASSAPTTDDANNVFRVMHGFYGNLFLSKFATGEVRPDGSDGGVSSARVIWAHGLRTFPQDVVKTALARTMSAHPEYPPTLPQFVQLCKACAPRDAAVYALPAPTPNRAELAKKARDLLLRIRSEQSAEKSGLSMLFAAIADAVRCAGGDEGAELARIDRMFKPKGIAA